MSFVMRSSLLVRLVDPRTCVGVRDGIEVWFAPFCEQIGPDRHDQQGVAERGDGDKCAYESKNKDVGEHRSNSPGMDESVSVAGAAAKGQVKRCLPHRCDGRVNCQDGRGKCGGPWTAPRI